MKQCATDLTRDKHSDMGDFVQDKSADFIDRCVFKKNLYIFFLLLIFSCFPKSVSIMHINNRLEFARQ